MSQIGEAFVRVRAIADTRSFETETARTLRSNRQIRRELDQTERQFGRFSRGALVGTGALQGLGRAAAFASVSFIGGAGLIYALKSTIAAAEESQVVLGQTENAVKRAGLSWDQYGETIQKAALAQAQLSGFDDERLLRTFSTFIRKTKDVNEALRLNALAANVARGRNIELEQATQLVLRASIGQAGALRRLGIDAPKAASGLQLIALLNEKYAGSAAKFADTAAGAQARFNVALQNTQETIGTALLPTITRLLDQGTAWLNQEKNQEKIQRDLNSAISTATTIVHGLADALGVARSIAEPLVEIVGGLKNAVELLLIAMAVAKVRSFALALGVIGPAATTAAAGVATAETSIAASGVAAGTAATRVGTLRGALLRLGALSAIVVGIDLVVNRSAADRTISQFLRDHGLPGGGQIHTFDQLTADLGKSGIEGELAREASAKLTSKLGVNPATNPLALGPIRPTAEEAARASATAAASGGTPAQIKAKASRDIATQTALAKAQAEGTSAQIRAAAESRLEFIRDTISFAKKLEGQRGQTKDLEATLQKFYGDEESTQGIIDALSRGSATATAGAEKVVKKVHDTTAAVAAAKRVKEEALAAAVAAAKQQIETQNEIQLLILQNNLARAQLIPNVARELKAERAAQMVIVEWYRQRARQLGLSTVAGQQAESEYLSALAQYRSLGEKSVEKVKKALAPIKKAAATKSSATIVRNEFSLQDLFKEAGSEFATYGSNIGPRGAPLSRQDSRASLAQTVKTNQTIVVQHFNYPVAASQALNDAKNAAKNLR